MSKKRTQYTSEFKAKVALAAIRGDKTIPQLATRYGIHPTQINSRKQQLIEQAAELFPSAAICTSLRMMPSCTILASSALR
ncbi:transposase [Nitrosomonas sp.]|uniref:transposase n=1 Tax=Nitrosomonas sp. TaxID=42353 RepID=UPI00374DB896